ncbi:MAG: aminopeptidase [Moraxellaceae bacterium]|nr:aminopeptidase [Moraxellaceae bacterium]
MIANQSSAIFRGFVLLTALLLGGCQSLGYYWQAAQGQGSLLLKRQSVERLLARDSTPPQLRERLRTVQRIRAFAVVELGLPAQRQYGKYVELGREYPVWSVSAAPELSLQPRHWCYWFVGCLSYRGFFREEAAQRYAAALAREGYDVSLAGITAYSTLGWFHDPVLSSFVHLPEAELAELLFHELAHQVLFVPGDTVFSESFAVTLAEEGLRRYSERFPQDLSRLRLARQRRDDFVKLVLEYRGRLDAVFAQPWSAAEKRAAKARVYAELQEAYAAQKREWGGHAGYDDWFAGINNARLNTVATYYDQVPALQQLLREKNGDLAEFVAACRRLARMDPASRARELASRLTASAPTESRP